jgi:nucleoside-diphosphate-sugar epimerase
MKILVTGGAGYVGGHLVDQLALDGHDVHVVDSLLYEDQILKPVRFSYGDIRDTQLMKKLSVDADCVIWLAALVGDPVCSIDPRISEEINTTALANFIENYSGKLIFISTCSVYGAQNELLDESAVTNPLSVYASTKLASEELLAGRPDTLIFRLGTLFGVGDNWSRLRLDLAVNVLTQKAFIDHEIEMFGGEQWRPFLHVKDVGNVIVMNINDFKSGTYNLASENVTISELVKKISQYMPNIKVKATPLTFQDARNYRVSSAKAKSVLKLPQFISIETGIKEIISILEEGRIPRPGTNRFRNVTALNDLWGIKSD